VTAKGDGASSGAGATAGSAAPKAFSRGAFPVPKLDGSRAIIRQNAVTNANSMMGHNGTSYDVGALIALAREIEAYTTGDIEADAVKERIASEFDPNE